MRVRLALGLAGVGCVVWFAAAGCSSTDRPGASELNHDGGDSPPVVQQQDASTDASDRDSGHPLGDSGAPASCSNTIQDGTETDVDCGGTACPPCIDGKACVSAKDCKGGSCTANTCVTANCSDNKPNNDESDVDCGGATCAKCGVGKRCNGANDCQSGVCDPVNGCTCPPRMVVVTIPDQIAGSYCMDATEVTSGDYDRFIKANQSTNQQIAECKPPVNTTYVPIDHWPPPQPLSIGYALPVRDVDWCDAYAYCKWAGKQLCGKIGGGENLVADASDETKSSWFNGCSAQGQNVYPYGQTYESTRCTTTDNPSPAPYAPGPRPVVKYNDDGTYAGLLDPAARTCQGGAVGLYEMSGNVAEWEDSCDGAGCLLRGGSLTDGAAAATCEATTKHAKQLDPATEKALGASIGFRCCQY